MTLKNWPNGFARACATISLLACGRHPRRASRRPAKSPAIALMDAGDAVQWQNWTDELGWQVIVARRPLQPAANIDARVQALAAAVEAAIQSGTVDPARVYIAGRGDAAATVFYAHLAHARPVGGGRGARRIAQSGARYQSHLRGEFHQRAGDVAQRRRRQAAGGQAERRQAESGMAAGRERRQRRRRSSVAGAAQARRLSRPTSIAKPTRPLSPAATGSR